MKTTLILITAILPATLSHAGTSASADYSITTDVLDAGGRKTTSAGYANDGSIGAIGQLTSSGDAAIRSGFPGQLYDLTNVLQVNLSPATIGEGTSLQLGVQAVADDSTLLTLAPSSVAWSTAGPLSISAAGMATGGAVYENTAATAMATLGAATGSLPITVVDTLEDNFGLYAADGITDSWQVAHFGVDSPDGLATADPDDDQQNNRLEFLATTTPNDPESRLRLRVQPVPGSPTRKALVFSPYNPARTYVAEWTSIFDEWRDLSDITQGEEGGEFVIIDEMATQATKTYRLRISR